MRTKKEQARGVNPQAFDNLLHHFISGKIAPSIVRIMRDRFLNMGEIDAAAACDHYLLRTIANERRKDVNL